VEHEKLFQRLVVEGTPLIDVRSPKEFAEGAFETAVNLPLMDDEERHLVGIRYAEEGSDAALELGHELVSGEKKEARVQDWLAFLEKHPDAVIYCFRGGMRSKIAREWIQAESGIAVPRLDGGYKAFRRYLIEGLDTLPDEFEFILLAGRTGSGKTILLKKLRNAVDLEKLANHRGSAFGKALSPQPTQINFENNLAFELIRRSEAKNNRLVLEDESRGIGRRIIPPALFAAMRRSPIVILETPFEQRVETILGEYVLETQKKMRENGEKNVLNLWEEMMAASLAAIRKRLGTERHAKVAKLLSTAVQSQRNDGDTTPHRKWIAALLKQYYDPMYDHQIEARKEKILLRGDADTLERFLRSEEKAP